MNYKPTIDTIKDAAEQFRYRAKELDRMARALEESKDWSIAGEAISCCTNCLKNIRLDLLSIRPTRELERHISKANAGSDPQI